MLSHSPSLPLIIDHVDHEDVTAEDEDGIRLALQYRNRIRRIRLLIPIPKLEKLFMSMNEEFPLLELLYIGLPIMDHTTNLIQLLLPNTFLAPRLRYLILKGLALPIKSP
jgi:hypothetical protein